MTKAEIAQLTQAARDILARFCPSPLVARVDDIAEEDQREAIDQETDDAGTWVRAWVFVPNID